jgi:hypothetical protein
VFGLKSVGAFVQSSISKIFMDDNNALRRDIKRMTAANLKIRWDKSHLCATEGRLMGMIMPVDGIRPDPAKVSVI